MDLNLTSYNYPFVQKVLFKLKPLVKDGPLLNICYSKTNKGRLIYSCFHQSDYILAVASNNGSIYVIDYCSGKYWKLPRQEFCTAIAFSILNSEELLVGIKNGEILIINFESGCVNGKLEGHKLAVKNFSFSQNHCLSFSESEAILWDLTTNSKIRVLHLEEDVGLKQVMFIPVSCYILACFQDDFIQIWKLKDCQSVKQFVPLNWKNRSIKSISFTKNGQNMVVAGYLPTLAFFFIDTWRLSKFISLPEQILTVKHAEFVSQPFDGGCNKILAILSGQGVIYFYNVDENVILSELTANSKISRFCLCPKGRYISLILCSGDVQLYNLEQYILAFDNVPVQRAMSVAESKKHMKKRIDKEIEDIKCQIDSFLELDKLKSILEKYGEYPEVHRLKIWEKLLKLPDNLQLYNGIINHVTLVAFPDLYKKYPLESKISIQALKKLLNNIVTWCPFFANVDFLPVFAFPFVKVFHNKPASCFEAICTIIVNWCQYWFEYFPLPPVNILAIIENILLEHDPELLNFFRIKSISPNLYFWSLLETAFSEVLSSTEWLLLWDHVLTNEIVFLHCAVVAYVIVQKNTLMTLVTFEDFYNFFHCQNPVNMKKFIKTTYYILNNTVEKMHPRQYLEKFSPLDNRRYPIFNEYPKVILEVEDRCKKIDDMLDEVLECRKVLEEVDKNELEKQQKRVLKEEEKRRLKEMEEQCLKKLKEKQSLLKSEQDKLQKFELSSCEKIKMYSGEENSSNTEKESREKYLAQLKVLLMQKYKLDDLIKGSKSQRYEDLDEKISKIDKSLISIEKLKKMTVAVGLALLEKVIKNVELQVDNEPGEYSKSKSSDALNGLKQETRILEKEIIHLLGSIAKRHQEPFTKHKKPSSLECTNGKSQICKCEEVCSKQVRFSESTTS